MHDDVLAELMHTETDSPPPMRIDLAMVIRDGKRRRRRRALVVPVVAGVAALAVAAGAGVLANGHSAAPPNPPSVTAAPTPTAPAAFDPMRLHAAAGWTPEGMIADAPVSAPGAQQFSFSARQGTLVTAQVVLTVYAAGITPRQFHTEQDVHRPQPTI